MKIPSDDAWTEFLTKRHEVSTQEIYDWLAQSEPHIPRSTVNWRVYEMVREGRLVRVGRGRFRQGAASKQTWAAPAGSFAIGRILSEEFPLAASCLWSTEILAEFQQHLSATPFTVVEVEKDALSGVFYRIKENLPDTFLEPAKKVVEEYVIGRREAVVVKALISESPLLITKGVRLPTLEKILVDLVADQDLFFFLQGTELGLIYQNAMAKYTLQTDRLLRYARRRGRGNEVAQLLNYPRGSS